MNVYAYLIENNERFKHIYYRHPTFQYNKLVEGRKKNYYDN